MRLVERPPQQSVFSLSVRVGESTATPANGYVDEVRGAVDEPVLNDVTFEHYEGVPTDANGISPEAGGGKVACFNHPDANTFAVEGDR